MSSFLSYYLTLSPEEGLVLTLVMWLSTWSCGPDSTQFVSWFSDIWARINILYIIFIFKSFIAHPGVGACFLALVISLGA